ncbi:type II secretion system secretin GspD [bacterium]|nr:type II secretion system secretin GspD [bacterium]
MNTLYNKTIWITLIALVLFATGVFCQPLFAETEDEQKADVVSGEEEQLREEISKKPEEKPEEELVYLNVQDGDIKEIIKQISKATGKNFIIDDKIRGKVTIISERKMTKEEAYQAFLSALEVVGYTTVTGPAGIIKIVALRDAAKQPIPTHVDTTPYTDSYITRLISLDNISALDMSNAIKGLISKDGNLFAYPETNTLIITDSGTNIDRLMKIIKELDQEGPQEIVEIIPIKNAAARDVAQMVIAIFQDEKSGSSSAARRRSKEPEDVAAFKSIIADERTNAVIVVASKRSIEKVRELIARLDKTLSAGDEGTIHVHYLGHANAKDLADTLSSLTSAAGKSAGKKGSTDVVVAEFEGGMKISADESTNALIITSSAKDYRTLIDKVISKLDIPRKQVYLESIIMELSMSKNRNLGVSAHGGGGGGAMGFGQTGFSESGGALGQMFNFTNLIGSAGILGGLFSRDTVSVNVPDSGGAVKTYQVPQFSAFLTAIQTYGDTNIVSTPNILTLDNEEAEINVQSEEPVIETTVGQTGFASSSTKYEKAGLVLKITPQISEHGTVKLKIEQELSNFQTPKNTTIASGAQAKVVRKVNTSVVTEDGQTVVLGGLMEDQITNQKSKIPLLGDIPLLGFLFRSTSTQKAKKNLLIFITPYIIRDTSDFSAILKRKIEERNRFIESSFGRKQQRIIREAIQEHRKDLLEFQPGAGYGGTRADVRQTTIQPYTTTGGTTTQQTQRVRPPVITITPPDGTPSGDKSYEDLDLAY